MDDDEIRHSAALLPEKTSKDRNVIAQELLDSALRESESVEGEVEFAIVFAPHPDGAAPSQFQFRIVRQEPNPTLERRSPGE